MSEKARNLAIVASIAALTVVLILSISTEPAETDRVQEIGAQIRCPVCQGESIADSPATMARDMMSLVAERVDRGATDQQIIDELLASYSGAVLLDPPVSGSTLVLWLAPAIVLVAGVGVIAWWRRHPGTSEPTESTAPRSRRRVAVGAFILVGALAGVIAIAAASLQDEEATATGVAAIDTENLNEVSSETMEAVISSNADHPQINGMRLVLAARYYEAGDYRSAFPHYLAVAEDPNATATEAITSLTRLGWMAYAGNGEIETALSLLDEALEIDPASQIALYMKGTVLWCGKADPIAAGGLFTQLLADPQLRAETRDQIEADLARIEQDETCP